MHEMGSKYPHCSQSHPNGFHPVSPETFKRVGFKQLKFTERTCGFIADLHYYEFSY